MSTASGVISLVYCLPGLRSGPGAELFPFEGDPAVIEILHSLQWLP